MKKTLNNHSYVLIMAGGSGTRLFPRSTDKLPKQFQKIIGEKTLIEQTYDRVKKTVDDDHIYISSNHKYLDLIKKHLPNIPNKNYITEPVKRNTGPAMALATSFIYEKDKDAIIVTVCSDHLVAKEDDYVTKILTGIDVVKNNRGHILCIGITPTSPNTGYGYIEKGKEFLKKDDHVVYTAKRFVEKPNLELAKKYLVSGNFFWNAAYFIWEAKHLLDELKKQSPKMHGGIKKITKAKNKKDYLKVLDKEFFKFENIAIDYLIMEKTKNLLVLPADIGWSDIGSWDVVVDMVGSHLKDKDGNYAEGAVVNIDTRNTTIFSHDKNKIIATVGLDNFIIITTEDATVIVPKGRSEDVKKIVDELINKKSINI
ncbi:MAG: sugar phosphate nucleotidyltransferase [bacterium]